MADALHWILQEHGEAFDAFTRVLDSAIASRLPGDYWVVLGNCPQCQQPLKAAGLSAFIVGGSQGNPIPQANLYNRMVAAARAGPSPCPHCHGPVGVLAGSSAYVGRVALLIAKAYVVKLALPPSEPPADEEFVYSPGGQWVTLGVNPHPDATFKAFGRAVHPVIAAASVLRTVRPSMQFVGVDISPESIVAVMHRGYTDEQVVDYLTKLAIVDGRVPPFAYAFVRPGRVDPSFEEFGMGDLYQQLSSKMGIGLAYVSSLPMMAARTQAMGEQLGVAVEFEPESYRGKLRKEGRSVSFDLGALGLMGPGAGLTFDEVVYEVGFSKVMGAK